APAKRILFVMRHEGYVRNCEYVLQELARRGHQIHLALGTFSRAQHDARALPRLAEAYPTITYDRLPLLPIRPWDDVTAAVRAVLDYLRYFEPLYDYAPRLRARVEKRVPQRVVRLVERLAVERRPRIRRALNA